MNKFIRIIKCAIPLILLVTVLAILIYEYKKPDNKEFAGMAAFVKDSNTYISMVMGCDTDDERYRSTLSLVSKYAGL